MILHHRLVSAGFTISLAALRRSPLCYEQTNRLGVIVEIKNQIDRYVVPRLVRYRTILLWSCLI